VIVLEAGQRATRDDILGYMKGKIADWGLPDDVSFVDEIPHAATGKIHKTTLRAQMKNYVMPSAVAVKLRISGRTLPWDAIRGLRSDLIQAREPFATNMRAGWAPGPIGVCVNRSRSITMRPARRTSGATPRRFRVGPG
jgi:hypothetical protein